jgi:hypothetical protein
MIFGCKKRYPPQHKAERLRTDQSNRETRLRREPVPGIRAKKQLEIFPKGQFVIEVKKVIAGFCMTMITTEERAIFYEVIWKN